MAGVSEAAFEAYFAARVPALRRSAYLLTGNWHDAEDIVQAAFVRLYGVWHRVRYDSADAYVRRVLVNVFLSTKRGQPAREHPVPDVPDSPAVQASAEDRVAMRGALASLTPGQRAVVVLRYWEGLSVAETAATLGVSEGTVKSQTHRAVLAMRPHLAEDGVR
ncbi:MAG TPA: SigE family RNA polymerase sigma factor [Actinophytocola sp.]|uniref:SigE family RNA polymerase sigma factor n=1 Tax=Actinophytocola sp. TaxID=1872138 RepID=UPI002DDD18B4|nr:SigE family RNA polymerase sigma factor [Actinophytocola sp.]HEV2778860.1 SigE family RNA polymerase sigma factor [Actinophytocola sp.]